MSGEVGHTLRPAWRAPRELRPPALGELHLWRRLHSPAEARGDSAGWRLAILARYCGQPAEALRLVRSERGKPGLDPALGGGLHFSTAHASGMSLLAVAPGEVGVDLERIEDFAELDAVAELHFPATVLARWRTRPAADRIAAFFVEWTRLEARLKAQACGFGGPERAGWHGAEVRLALPPGHVGALASAQPIVTVCGFDAGGLVAG